jgi:hypothetical protein
MRLVPSTYYAEVLLQQGSSQTMGYYYSRCRTLKTYTNKHQKAQKHEHRVFLPQLDVTLRNLNVFVLPSDSNGILQMACA